MSSSRCESCNAEIVWANISGKPIPLNWRRVRVYVESAIIGEFLELLESDISQAEDLGDDPLLVRNSHFITCPQASEWGKGR